MTAPVVPLDGGEVPPAVMPSPFAVPPHPLAQRAARELADDVRSGRLGIAAHVLDAPGGGKMFGVLVVRTGDGALGYLRAFSGMLDGAWELPGFVPPVFDQTARDAMWPAGQAVLRTHEVALRELLGSSAYTAAHAALRAWQREHAAALEALQAKHRTNRAARRTGRAHAVDDAARHAFDQQSRADVAERRRFDDDHDRTRAQLEATVAAFEVQRTAIEHARAAESRALMDQVIDQYVIVAACGETRGLRELFAPHGPPGGAGDCAAPKLLAAAYRRGLTPLALAEIWIGAPPAIGGRIDGAFYPACRGKCGPILPFMLAGLPHDPAPEFATRAAADEPRVIWQDEHLIVVDKPAGMLSVPGRSGALRDSVQTRLRARGPTPDGGPHLAHRLDLETSGILVAASSLPVRAQLQAQFARREVHKGYVAILAGAVPSDTGTIDLPLRVDLDDRPRQIVDPVHGKPAITHYRVLARDASRTRIALSPHTGRTHQLRVHCAHPSDLGGLGTPIVGDRLYGAHDAHAEPRMLLHAEAITFTHPITGARLELRAPPPF